MLYPALRSLVCAVCVLGVITTIPSAARADDLALHFDQLEELVSRESPLSHILEHNIARLRATRDRELQWENPTVSYQHEEIEDFREYEITLSKRITMPWLYAREKAGWSARIDAAEARTNEERADLLANVKSGYVKIGLLDEHLERLEQLEDIINEARAVAEARHAEGELSSVEERLVQLSALSIDSSRRKSLQLRRRFEAVWRGELGVAPDINVVLTTEIDFVPVTLEPSSRYIDAMAAQPGTRARVALERALGIQASAAGPSVLPDIEVYAGYKHVDPDGSGLVAGVAATVPLFNWSGAEARRIEADQRIAASELSLYRSRVSAEVEALVTLINDAQRSLEAFAEQFAEDRPAVGSLLYSYREGWLNLDGFLGGIRIEVDGLNDYYDQLTAYYENIFRLEALTGAKIISFE